MGKPSQWPIARHTGVAGTIYYVFSDLPIDHYVLGVYVIVIIFCICSAKHFQLMHSLTENDDQGGRCPHFALCECSSVPQEDQMEEWWWSCNGDVGFKHM